MDSSVSGNMEIDKKKEVVSISINPKIFPLDVIYSAAYVFLDKAYVIIDGDPEEEIVIELKPKDASIELETLGREFNNELLNYSAYKVQSEKNASIRQLIIQRALFTNDSELEKIFNAESSDESYLDDPEGIAIPWEEKFGEKDEKPKKK
jgi:His-Xaa-Ser system protein HxsD